MANPKIVLIQPPSPYLLIEKWLAPLNLYYLKAFLNKNGYAEVSVINLAGLDAPLEALPLDGDIYGVTLFTPQFPLAQAIASHLKQHTSGMVIAGGHHVSALPSESLEASCFDIVVRGEGEWTLLDIVAGRRLSEVAGISYRDERGDIVHNADRKFHPTIDDFCFPNLDDIPLAEYPGMTIDKEAGRFEMSFMTSRGCPFDCAFCASKKFWKRKVRFHSAAYIMAVLDDLHERGIHDVRFEDDNFDLNKDRLAEILSHLKKRGFGWGCCMRSENVTDETIGAMVDAGLTDVALGIETACDRVLKLINKNETAAEHGAAVAILKRHEVRVKAYIMSGLPGEDQQSVDETVRFIREQPIDSYTVSTFVPFPGTDIWHHPGKYGYAFDKQQCFANFTFLSNRANNPSVAQNADELGHFHQQLCQAAAEKNTLTRSANVARNLEGLNNWKTAFVER